MIRDHRVFSPHRNKKKNKALSSVIKVLILIFIFYQIINSYFLTTYSIDSVSMNPVINANDRLLGTPLMYGLKIPFINKTLKGLRNPGRGDLVVLNPPNRKKKNFFLTIINPFIKFFTFNNVSLGTNPIGTDYLVKRIIGIPGDRIIMENYLANIKPENSELFIPEKDLISRVYTLITELNEVNENIEGWKEDFPFSGRYDEIVLGKNEYFVLGDNRLSSSDSRSWGNVNRTQIRGKVLLRYAPVLKFKLF